MNDNRWCRSASRSWGFQGSKSMTLPKSQVLKKKGSILVDFANFAFCYSVVMYSVSRRARRSAIASAYDPWTGTCSSSRSCSYSQSHFHFHIILLNAFTVEFEMLRRYFWLQKSCAGPFCLLDEKRSALVFHTFSCLSFCCVGFSDRSSVEEEATSLRRAWCEFASGLLSGVGSWWANDPAVSGREVWWQSEAAATRFDVGMWLYNVVHCCCGVPGVAWSARILRYHWDLRLKLYYSGLLYFYILSDIGSY